MSLATLFWPACIILALLAIGYVSWYSMQHIQRATDSERSYRAERRRVLATYNSMRFRRVDDSRYAHEPRVAGSKRHH